MPKNLNAIDSQKRMSNSSKSNINRLILIDLMVVSQVSFEAIDNVQW